MAESLQATVAEEQVAHGILSRQDGISQPRSKQDVSGSYLGGDANSPGFGEDSSYGTGDALDTASSQLSPRKRHNHGFKPINRGNTTRLSSWSSSSTCAAESPSTRFLSHSRSVSYSAPSPLTTVSTPGGGDESCSSSKASTYAPSSPNIRRLSVQSLLASPHDPPYPNERTFSGPGRSSLSLLTRAITPETATFYGYDRGEPDKDLGQNVDEKVILGHSPVDTTGRHEFPSEETPRDNHPSDFGFGMRETRNYYERRVEVWISKELEPLPPKLRQSPMNLLYFHHFLNHTARVLVPHDDPRSNPFRTVLPQMAVKHDNLLSLLLAYSASHRARHLKYPEPSLRIADLVQGVISDLSTLVQQAMHDPNTLISTADLATAIMLASLEIVSPAAIGGSIPWHHHLNLARELISRMPDGLRRITPTSQDDRVRAFLWSWFAYLDVLGSLSGGPATLLTPACYTSASDTDTDVWDEDMERIDCILGFTPRCVFILARIAELARHTESIRSSHPDPFIIPSSILSAAATLETAALRSLAAPSRPCGHVHAPTPLRRWDRSQMAAANRAFHHAALIHLHRRVLGKGSGHPDVRGAAQSVLECLEHVERGSSAETCLLFPMFTAGCELVDEEERGVVLGRILGVERTGMTQVSFTSDSGVGVGWMCGADCGDRFRGRGF